MGFLDKILNRQKTEANQGLPVEVESNNSGAARGAERKKSSELGREARRLFAAGVLFAASVSGANFTGNEAQAGERSDKPEISGINYDRDQMIKDFDAEVKTQGVVDKINNKEAIPMTHKQFVNQVENSDQQIMQELFGKAIQRIKQEISTQRDYSHITNSSFRRSAENNYKLRRAALETLLKNPEKAQKKLMNENTIFISFEYPHPDSGFTQIFDYSYKVEKK
jgi:hypothetical protein